MPPQETTLPDRAEWRAQHVRMIAFPVDPQLAVDQNWWSEVTGNQPETSVRKAQTREDSGVYEDVALSVEVDPFRVEWTAKPKVDPENIPDDFPTLGPAFDRRDWLIKLMGRWLEHCPPVKRLSFAGSLLQFVDSKEEAYCRLNKYLHGIQVDVDDDTSDFMYRVNRRRDSQLGIKSLRINRICTWSVISVGLRAVQTGTDETLSLPIGKEQYACVLHLDINTLPDFPEPELPHDALLHVFTELVDVGLEMAEQGDCR